MFKNFLKYAVRQIIRNINPSYYFYFIYFVLFKKNKKINKNKIVILALNPFRFRDDLEIIEKKNIDFFIYRMLFSFQCFLFTCFYTDPKSEIHEGIDKEVKREQIRYQDFLRKFLPLLVNALKIKVVIGPGLFYRQDYDMAKIFKEIQIPVLIFHREGNLGSVAYKESFASRCKLYSNFHGTAIMVHNKIQNDIIVNSKYMDKKNVHIIGVLRMDKWIKANRFIQNKKVLHKRITLFSFGPGAVILTSKPPQWPLDQNNYMPVLAKEVHKTVINFAIQNPKIEVIIKCKWLGTWKESLLKLINFKESDLNNIPNLLITAEKDAQKLISMSDVVIGFGSTTLLEASIANKAVIIPHFAEITKESFINNVYYKDNFSCFDIANSSDELFKMISKYTTDYISFDHLRLKRKNMFEDYVSPLDATAVKNSHKYIMSYAKQKFNNKFKNI